MIHFILNNKLIATDKPPGLLLLDLVRYHEHLKGTKIGCREGDCGACTVLIGEWMGGQVRYRSATSCLTALGNIHNKHVVTIEGVNRAGRGPDSLNPLQQAICEEGGSQCGFCTPGFIMSMTGFTLAEGAPTMQRALAAVDGNICRCTGYKSIEKALDRVTAILQENKDQDRLSFLVQKGILPPWFKEIPHRLRELSLQPNGSVSALAGSQFLGGGTDLYVQRHESMPEADIRFLFDGEGLQGVLQQDNVCQIGGAATITDLLESPVIQKGFPRFGHIARLISSTPIRNIATVAGNFVNASPIGDLSIFFLAMDAKLLLSDGRSTRQLPLREFYLGYKKLNKTPEEWIEKIWVDLPAENEYCHFEKVSKRTHLDIASVNTAIRIRMEGDRILEGNISAGGVGPVPAWLAKTSAALQGQRLDEQLVMHSIAVARSEISPISDARGSAAYKTLLLGQLIKAHFLTLFPSLQAGKLLEA